MSENNHHKLRAKKGKENTIRESAKSNRCNVCILKEKFKYRNILRDSFVFLRVCPFTKSSLKPMESRREKRVQRVRVWIVGEPNLLR